jgi:hypothetical protein
MRSERSGPSTPLAAAIVRPARRMGRSGQQEPERAPRCLSVAGKRTARESSDDLDPSVLWFARPQSPSPVRRRLDLARTTDVAGDQDLKKVRRAPSTVSTAKTTVHPRSRGDAPSPRQSGTRPGRAALPLNRCITDAPAKHPPCRRHRRARMHEARSEAQGRGHQSRSGTGTLNPFKVVETSAYRPTR